MKKTCTLLSFLLLCGTASASFPPLDAGFVMSSGENLQGYKRVRALGPVFERQKSDDGKVFTAVRPFFSSTKDPERDRAISDYAWPLGMVKYFRGDTYWRFLTAYGQHFDESAPKSRYRFVVYPIFQCGRAKDGEGYLALFPVGGKVREHLGREKIVFVMFPLYMYHSVKDIGTHEVLFPLISWTESEDISRLRVLPFYAKSENRRQGQTNKAIMWPFWSTVKYSNAEPGDGAFVLFPLCGYGRKNDERTWMFLPPLFRYSKSIRNMDLNCPWPLIQWSRGSVNKSYLWPLYGRKTWEGASTSFVLWPLIRTEKKQTGPRVRKYFSVTPIIKYESLSTKGSPAVPGDQAEAQTKSIVEKRYMKLWPLMSYRRNGEASRFRVLDLEPLRTAPGYERNLAPFATLYTRENTGKAKEDELLWGLMRYRRDNSGSRYLALFPLYHGGRSVEGDGSREWSFLQGLVGYKREGLRKKYRLLYFLKFGDDE